MFAYFGFNMRTVQNFTLTKTKSFAFIDTYTMRSIKNRGHNSKIQLFEIYFCYDIMLPNT